jgi:hypothetical protein
MKKRKQATDHTEARKKQAVITTNGEGTTQKRAARTNRGGGGPAKKIEDFDKATERSKRKKSGAPPAIPESELLNPMAPAGKNKITRRRFKEKVSSCVLPHLALIHAQMN